MKIKNNKSLEETIKELGNKYKNTPSPLSENYNKMNKNVHFASNQQNADVTSKFLDGFKPKSTRFGEPL